MSQQPHPGEQMLTVEEAAAELKVSPKTVYPLCVPNGPMPHVRAGKLIRIPRSKFEQYKRGELNRKGQLKEPPLPHQAAVIAKSNDETALAPRPRSKKKGGSLGTKGAASS